MRGKVMILLVGPLRMRLKWTMLIPLAGCLTPRIRTAGDAQPIVTSIHFDGNGGGISGTGDYLVRNAMVQEDSPTFWRLAPRQRAVHLRTDELYRDAWRIETWYAHQGYFDARFLGWEVVQTRERRGRTPTVKLVGHIDEGPPTLVDSVSWVIVGEDGEPSGEAFDAGSRKAVARRIRNAASVKVGDRFVLSAHDATKDETLRGLKDMSFAYAEVEGRVVVDADTHKAELRYLCRPGPPCDFGEVTITGSSKVPRELITDQIQIEEGSGYSAEAISSTQRDLFGLGTFSVVNVVPQLSDTRPLPPSELAEGETAVRSPPDDVIPVRIELQDSRWRQLRAGGGVAVENGKEELRVSADFRHSNLMNRLLQLQLSGQGGYTWLAQWSDIVSGETSVEGERLSGGPSVTLGLGLDAPHFLGPKLRLENDLGFELGVEETYQYATPTFSTVLTWRPKRYWTFGFGSMLQYFRYFNTIGSWSALSTSGSDLDTQNPYFLTALSQSVLYDSRPDPIAPTRGSFVSVKLDEALPPGGFDFVRLNVEGRHYFPLGRYLRRVLSWYPKVTLAGRLGGGLIQPYTLFGEGRDSVPFAERLYTGGSNSVRGWQSDHLGPYAWECEDGSGWCFSDTTTRLCEDGQDCAVTTLPTGGTVSFISSLELRSYLPGQLDDIGLAAFADYGMVWSDLSSVRELPPQLSLGLGLRYKTPVGPLRVDVARRMSNPDVFAHESRFAFYFSLSEAY